MSRALESTRGRRGHTALVAPLVTALILILPTVAAGRQASTNPHGTLPENLTCTDCHTTTAWSPLRPDPTWSHDDTGFPLDGGHASSTCALCHAGLTFDRIDTGLEECAACHVDVHQGSMTTPCSGCHGTIAWTDLDPAMVHPADFPLEGAHLQIPCESCHRNDLGGAYRPLDRECATCHTADYLSPELVDHQALGFSLDCTECHSTIDFRDVVFDHFTLSTGFELTGAHRDVECTSCHSGPGGSVPGGTVDPTDCVTCHIDDYQGEHGGSDFPTDCLFCHNDASWDDASFDHTFSIFRGRHAQEWDRCEDCHTTPGDFGQFSCFACHGQSKTDEQHREEPGYLYDSATCITCHPTGNS
jgi:hypothetical protein